MDTGQVTFLDVNNVNLGSAPLPGSSLTPPALPNGILNLADVRLPGGFAVAFFTTALGLQPPAGYLPRQEIPEPKAERAAPCGWPRCWWKALEGFGTNGGPDSDNIVRSPAGPVEIQAFLQDLFTGTTTNPPIRGAAPVQPIPSNFPVISMDQVNSTNPVFQ